MKKYFLIFSTNFNGRFKIISLSPTYKTMLKDLSKIPYNEKYVTDYWDENELKQNAYYFDSPGKTFFIGSYRSIGFYLACIYVPKEIEFLKFMFIFNKNEWVDRYELSRICRSDTDLIVTLNTYFDLDTTFEKNIYGGY